MENIRIGDYVLYNDGRDSYAGTVIGISDDGKTATLKVVITVRDAKKFTEIDAPVSKLRKRPLA